MKPKIVMLIGGRSHSSNFIYNGIKTDFEIANVIVEEGVSRKAFLKRRAKRLGYWPVFGQILFQALCVPVLRFFSKKRIATIKEKYDLDETTIDAEKIINVSSVNSNKSLKTLKKLKPDVIIVNGTRIISKRILRSVDALFINTHAGITPKYRGVHGGYWALANDDKEHCGVTVHLVDAGIDTGDILYQTNITPTRKDNFVTYTYLQNAEGIKLLKKALADVAADGLQPKKSDIQESHLWYHPTIWFYLFKRIFKAVK